MNDYQEEESLALKNIYEQLRPQLLTHWSRRTGWTDERIDINVLSTFQFENVFFQRESDLNGILGLAYDDDELLLINSTIDRIFELSKPDEQ